MPGFQSPSRGSGMIVPVSPPFAALRTGLLSNALWANSNGNNRLRNARRPTHTPPDFGELSSSLSLRAEGSRPAGPFTPLGNLRALLYCGLGAGEEAVMPRSAATYRRSPSADLVGQTK
jgi:hypothetical protein